MATQRYDIRALPSKAVRPLSVAQAIRWLKMASTQKVEVIDKLTSKVIATFTSHGPAVALVGYLAELEVIDNEEN